MSDNGTSLALREQTAPAVMSDAEIDRTFRIAKALSMSGMFKDTRQAEQAFAKILIGRDLGLSPTEAMMGIHIVEGKPELSANLQAAFVKRSDRHDYKVLELTNDACEIAFYRDGEEIGRSRFTIEDAQTAGLVKDRGPWKSYPRNMVFARAMSNGVAFHCPEVTGGVRVYSEGEISGEERPAELPAETAASDDGDVPDAEVVDEAAWPVDDEALAVIREALSVGAVTQQRLDQELVAAGATDTTSLEKALQSIDPDRQQEVGSRIADMLAAAEETAK